MSDRLGSEWSRRTFFRTVSVSTTLASTGLVTAEISSGNSHLGRPTNIESWPQRDKSVPWGLKAKLTSSNGDSDDAFGYSVALSSDGTTAIVGASGDEDPNGEFGGSAYVFTHDGERWKQQVKLSADDGDSGDQFGQSVALSSDGTTAIVGASNDDDPNGYQAGSAYVFADDSGGWGQQAKLTADGNKFDRFGHSVAMSDDGATVIVGANGDDESNSAYVGSAYVFAGDGGEWTQQAKLSADDGDEEDFFGWSVAISSDGTTAIIGAYNDDDPNGYRAGSAYVFAGDGGEWTQQTKLSADSTRRAASEDLFGTSVALSDDGATAIVGASRDEDPNGDFAGSVYVFTGDGGEWTQQTKLTADDGDRGDRFGLSVALSSDGTTAIVGTPEDDDSNGKLAGSAYVFAYDDGEWTQQAKLSADDGDEEDFFGWSVALSSDGTTAIIGAYNDDDPNGEQAGSTYVLETSSPPSPQTTTTSMETTSSPPSPQTTTTSMETTNSSPEPTTRPITAAESNEGTTSTDGNGEGGGSTPGFGIVSVLAALSGAAYRHLRSTDDDCEE